MSQSLAAPLASAPHSEGMTQPRLSVAAAHDLESGTRERERFVVGQWEAGIFDWRRHCIPNGWMSCFCPCVSLAQISARIEPGSFLSMLLSQLVFSLVSWGFLITGIALLVQLRQTELYERQERLIMCLTICSISVLNLIVGVFSVRMIAELRGRVRNRFQIRGSKKDDKKQSGWCGACAIAQMATQVKSYKAGTCSFGKPDSLPAYIR